MEIINFILNKLKIIDQLLKKEPYYELQKLILLYDSVPDAPEILVLGDSVLERISQFDDNQNNLGESLREELRKIGTVEYITHSAYNPEIYYHMLSALQNMRNKPKIIIIPINMRCFSPQWYCNPKWIFENEIELLKKYKNNENTDLKIHTKVKNRKFNNRIYGLTEVSCLESPLRKVDDYLNIIRMKPDNDEGKFVRKKMIFHFHYMYNLDKCHGHIYFMKKIAQLASDMDTNVIFYLTPINYEAGDCFVGKVFSLHLNNNIHLLEDELSTVLNPIGKHFINYSTLLPSCYFFNEHDATEHLNQHGRSILAKKVYEFIEQVRCQE